MLNAANGIVVISEPMYPKLVIIAAVPPDNLRQDSTFPCDTFVAAEHTHTANTALDDTGCIS